jgi:hypothetical protein
MFKLNTIFMTISIIFMAGHSQGAEKLPEIKAAEQSKLKKTTQEARRRIRTAGIYRWNDSLRFLPTVTLSRRAPYEEYNGPGKETYLSASISFNQFFQLTEIATKKESEKRKALRRVESLSFSIEKLIERKYMILGQIAKMKKIVRSLEDPLEAARGQERIDALELKKNETIIEIERLYAEMEYVCVEVGG